MPSPLSQYVKARLQQTERTLDYIASLECLNSEQKASLHTAISSLHVVVNSLSLELPSQLSSDLPPTDGVDRTD